MVIRKAGVKREHSGPVTQVMKDGVPYSVWVTLREELTKAEAAYYSHVPRLKKHREALTKAELAFYAVIPRKSDKRPPSVRRGNWSS
jgi:hypothetical protein